MNETVIVKRDLVYYVSEIWDHEGDKRLAHYPFMQSGPWSVLLLISAYLYFVKIYGPRLMRDRQPIHVRELMLVYNFLMVLVSGWMFYEGCIFLNFGLDAWGCPRRADYTTEDPATRRFLFVAWLFFFTKLIEFADTIFMVLRKRFDMISNLHVIHHSSVPISVWMGIKFSPVGVNAWFPLLNSFVHTIMYAYYGLSAVQDNLEPGIARRLRVFKPWVTRVQIFQFCLAIVHVAAAALQTNCKTHFPQSFFILNLGNATLFLGLFFNFYRKCYRSGKKERVE